MDIRGNLLIIKAPMLPDCRVAVLIPVFNESLEVALMPLLSLAGQTGADKRQYEVVLIVSNARAKALEPCPEFLQNQKIIALINFLNSRQKKCPFRLNQSQWKKVTRIRSSGLVIHLIDRSSPALAGEYDSANLARNLAGTEICQRFLSVPAGENGVIAMTDCDCVFSKNYISELIKTFQIPSVNRAAGKWLTQTDRRLPHREFVEKAVAIHLAGETSRKHYVEPKKTAPLVRQKFDNLTTLVPTSGQNLAVRVRAWQAVGGIKPGYSFADIIFGYQVSRLPGETVFNANFWVSTLIRLSDRVGVVGLGRRVKTIVESIDSFALGKADKIYIPDRKKISGLFAEVISAIRQGRLNKKILLEHLAKYGVESKYIETADIESLIALLTAEIDGEIGEGGVNKVEGLLLSKFYGHFPKRVLSLAKIGQSK